DQAIALLLGDQRQAQAGVAGGALDQDGARLEVTAALGRLDHRKTDAVLDRATWVEVLKLEVELARSGVQAARLDDGSAADEFEHGSVQGHSRIRFRYAASRSGTPDYRLLRARSVETFAAGRQTRRLS